MARDNSRRKAQVERRRTPSTPKARKPQRSRPGPKSSAAAGATRRARRSTAASAGTSTSSGGGSKKRATTTSSAKMTKNRSAAKRKADRIAANPGAVASYKKRFSAAERSAIESYIKSRRK